MKIPFLNKTKEQKNKRSKKSCFVFFIGDEGGILTHLKGGAVQKRLFSTTVDVESSDLMRELLSSSPSTPIYVLIDMMDQSYVKHTLPPVTKFSVQKLIKRRLERDFSPEDIKGSLPLGREKDGRRDWNYLLISLANSPALIQWLDFILELENPFKGIHLVPVEGEKIIEKLRQALFKKDNSRWQLLVTNNKVGGFRQIITKDGRLAFTRLTQAIGDNSPEVVAGNIEQEIMNTVEYLKRLSFSEDHGLNIVIIVSKDIRQAIDSHKLKAKKIEILTPHEAALHLQLDQASSPEDHYADVVLSAFFSTVRKKILPLQTFLSKKIRLYYKLKKTILIIGIISLISSIGYISLNISSLIPLLDNKNQLEKKIGRIQDNIINIKAKSAALPADVNRINDVVSIYEIFENQDYFPLTFIKQLINIMPEYVVVRSFQWDSPESLQQRFQTTDTTIDITVEIELLNNNGPVEIFHTMVQEFFDILETHFPEYYFQHSNLPGVFQKDERFETTIGQNTQSRNTLYLDGSPIFVTLEFSTSVPDPTNKRNRKRR